MNKHKIYVCHYKGYADRIKNLPSEYDYEIVSIGDGVEMPASLNIKHYFIMSKQEDAIIIEDDIILPPTFNFSRMIAEAKEQSLDIVFFGGVSEKVESSWGIEINVAYSSQTNWFIIVLLICQDAHTDIGFPKRLAIKSYPKEPSYTWGWTMR
jgi:hypothetical protein